MRFRDYPGNLREKRPNQLVDKHPPVKRFDQPIQVGTVAYVRSQNRILVHLVLPQTYQPPFRPQLTSIRPLPDSNQFIIPVVN